MDAFDDEPSVGGGYDREPIVIPIDDRHRIVLRFRGHPPIFQWNATVPAEREAMIREARRDARPHGSRGCFRSWARTKTGDTVPIDTRSSEPPDSA